MLISIKSGSLICLSPLKMISFALVSLLSNLCFSFMMASILSLSSLTLSRICWSFTYLASFSSDDAFCFFFFLLDLDFESCSLASFSSCFSWIFKSSICELAKLSYIDASGVLVASFTFVPPTWLALAGMLLSFSVDDSVFSSSSSLFGSIT